MDNIQVNEVFEAINSILERNIGNE